MLIRLIQIMDEDDFCYGPATLLCKDGTYALSFLIRISLTGIRLVPPPPHRDCQG